MIAHSTVESMAVIMAFTRKGIGRVSTQIINDIGGGLFFPWMAF